MNRSTHFRNHESYFQGQSFFLTGTAFVYQNAVMTYNDVLEVCQKLYIIMLDKTREVNKECVIVTERDVFAVEE